MTEEQSLLIANFRYGVVAPVVVQPLNRGEQARMLRELAGRTYNIPFSESTRVGERALERWLSLYRKGGLEALKPKERSDSGNSRAVPEEVLEKAKALGKEMPGAQRAADYHRVGTGGGSGERTAKAEHPATAVGAGGKGHAIIPPKTPSPLRGPVQKPGTHSRR